MPETGPAERAPQIVDGPDGRRLACHKTDGTGPGVVFLGGFVSDMTGTKAVYLEDWARAQGRAYLRLDYSGHGASSGRFDEGAISDWAADAAAVILAMCEGPQILVGSSMGGWIALLLARMMPDRIAGIVGIAAAPDFTEDSIWAQMTADQRTQLVETGRFEQPSGYDDGPYVFTRRLIDDGRAHLVLRDPLPLPFPVRLIQGTADEAVAQSVPLRIVEHADCPDLTLLLVKDADHRLSDPVSLRRIVAAIEDISP